MFAKQPPVLGKPQNELQAERRPLPLGGAAGSNGVGSNGNGIQTPHTSSTPPLHPSLQSAVASSTRTAPAPQSSAETEQSVNRLIVGPDVKLKGAEILDCDTLVVEGRVEAIRDSRVIRITEHGSFSGKVGIDVAEVFGEFDGDLTARQQLIIHATGRVSGKIRYGKLLVEEGGTLSGDVQSINASLGEFQSRNTPSSTLEKEVNTQSKSHLSTVAH